MKKTITKYFKIGEEELPFRFSINCFMYYSELFNNEITNIKTLRDIVNMTYCGYLAANDYLDIDEHFDEDDYKRLIDDYPTAYTEISNFMNEQLSEKKN